MTNYLNGVKLTLSFANIFTKEQKYISEEQHTYDMYLTEKQNKIIGEIRQKIKELQDTEEIEKKWIEAKFYKKQLEEAEWELALHAAMKCKNNWVLASPENRRAWLIEIEIEPETSNWSLELNQTLYNIFDLTVNVFYPETTIKDHLLTRPFSEESIFLKICKISNNDSFYKIKVTEINIEKLKEGLFHE